MKNNLVLIQVGKLTYSNFAPRRDSFLKGKLHRHLFWRFFWCIEESSNE